MFSKKPHVDIKKSFQKVLDTKKDSPSRLKHLRVLLEYLDSLESKNFFEHHYSHVYYIFFDTLSSLEGSFSKQKVIQKQSREELDSVLFIFEKIFVLLPELIKRRWQYHSIGIVMRKLLHPLNSLKVRQEGVRLFLLWYQILGDVAAVDLQPLFETLVPGIVPSHQGSIVFPVVAGGGDAVQRNSTTSSGPAGTTSYFYPSEQGVVSAEELLLTAASAQPIDIEPLVPSMPGDVQPKDPTCYFLQCLMEFMVTQVTKVQWREQKETAQLRCFQYLFEQFRRTFVRNIFTSLDENYSLYKQTFALPVLRTAENELSNDPHAMANRESMANSKAVVIRWFAKYLSNEVEVVPRSRGSYGDLRQPPMPPGAVGDHFAYPTEWREPTPFELDVVRSTLNANRTNVNLTHELFRQAFLLPFSQALTMRRVVAVYKDWINRNMSEVPLFMEDPGANHDSDQEVRAGMSKVLRAFITNAANIFLIYIPTERPLLLEEQVEMCKRILNIYRYMVMKIEMDKETWEQLLLVMLRITALVLSEVVPARKEDTLGGRLAPAFFQTLIVTWIRANLNVCIPLKLWEQFQVTVTMLTEWEELIREWSKTMDTITRVMSRMVYNINLHDLPLDRVGDKRDRRRRTIKPVSSDLSGDPVSNSTNHSSLHDGQSDSSQHGNDRPSLNRKRSNSGGESFYKDKTGKLKRSVSDSKLFAEIWRNKRRAELVAAKIVPAQGTTSRSLEYIGGRRIDSPCFSDSSPSHSRSPSPTPSSGIDTGSLKDSPLNFDGVSVNSGSGSNVVKCVINGGSYRGWAIDSAVVLWRRMLGILGDVNNLKDPNIHSQVLECLGKIVEDLLKVRDNLGVESVTSVSAPLLVPPVNFCSPWLFKTLTLGPEYKRGKLIAYKTLCLTFLRRYDVPPFPDSLCHFYRAIYSGLASKDPDIVNVIMKYSGNKFFSMGLPGSTCLLVHLLEAADSVLTLEGKLVPRFEALSFLGALIGMSNVYENIPQNLLSFDATVRRKDIKEHIVSQVIRSSKKEPSGMGRSIALNCLGLFMYQELANKNNHPRLREVTDLLLSATKRSLSKLKLLINNPTNLLDRKHLKFTYRVLSRVACDMLRLQCDHAVYLLDNHQDIPRKIIEGLAASLLAHVNAARKENAMKDYKDNILTIVLCLGEWCMSVPREFLKSIPIEGNSASLLSIVLSVMSSIVTERKSYPSPPTPATTPASPDIVDMDFTVFSDSGEAANISAPNTSKKSFVDGRTTSVSDGDRKQDEGVIRLAAKMCLGHLLNHVGHFPRPYLGAARLNCHLNENDDNFHISKCEEKDELNQEIFSTPNTLFFVVNNASIVSFTEITKAVDLTPDNRVVNSEARVRVITRDLIGKFAWDCSQLVAIKQSDLHSSSNNFNRTSSKEAHKPSNDDYDSDSMPALVQEDMIDSVMKIVSKSSPECILNRKRSGPLAAANAAFAQAEENMIALLLNQHYQEMNFMEQYSDSRAMVRNDSEPDFRAAATRGLNGDNLTHQFKNCRQLIDQFGFLFWEKRTKVELLGKSDKVLRELRNLDKQNCRETHKLAVIYVAEGQEDKNSILLNKSGSRAFETFVAGLGWEVDLEKHLGFRGGLQKNKSTGATTPYFATSFMEVVFHVSTRIPASLEDVDSLTKKLRHLGNDEIHIVWSEHWRDYRRDIIPTEFGDVLIVIYPVPSLPEYYRVHIFRKAEVPFFGPLYTGSVVHLSVLAGLVRATAINASRAQRLTVPFYQNFYEERARCIDSIVSSQEAKCFEDFAVTAYSPMQLGLLSSSVHSRPVSSLSNMTSTGGEAISLSSVQSGQIGELVPPRAGARNRPVSSGATVAAPADIRSSPRGGLRPFSAAAPSSGNHHLNLHP